MTELSVDESRAHSAKPWTIMALLAMSLGIGLRWWHLGRASLWFDEGYTAWVMTLPPAQLMRAIRADTAPPLFYLLLQGWVKAFGLSEFAMRSLSAVFSTLCLFVVWRIAVRLLREPVAVAVAVSLFSISVMQIAYSHEARFYAFIALLAAIDLYLVTISIDSKAWWLLPLQVITWTASLYTNNLMALYLGGLAAAWLILPGRKNVRRRLIELIVVGAIAGVAFLPWLPTMLAQSKTLKGNFWAQRPGRRSLLDTLSVLIGTTRSISNNLVPILLCGFIIWGLILRQTRRTTLALCMFGLAPVGLVFIYSRIGQPIFVDRSLIASTVVIPILIALPLTSPISYWQKILLAGVSVVLVSLGVCSLKGHLTGLHPEPWRDAIAAAATSTSTHPLTVFVSNEGELLYDYYAQGREFTPDPDHIGVPVTFVAINPPRTMRRIQSDQDMASLRAIINSGKYDEIILVESHYWWCDPHHQVRDYLESEWVLKDAQKFDLISVFNFMKQ